LTKNLYTFVLVALLLISPVAASDTKKLKGDESDGSRAVPVHLIPLLDEEGNKITPSDEAAFPFSPLKTCGGPDCHNVDVISKGWHFNALDPNIAPGRVGQPWIYVDPRTCTQIPLSYRPWPGTFRPRQLGITTWQFTQLFGRHFPGGGPGQIDSENPEEIMRSFVSGKLEVNCLACHNAHPGQDQAECAIQIARQNFRWAATGASELATVTGSAASMPETFDYKMPEALDNTELRPPMVVYRENIFDSKNQVLFDITRNIPNERCYFCHSNFDPYAGEKWSQVEDIHLKSGLKCIDCHRNGLEHNITRGYEGEQAASTNPLAGTLTCRSCHTRQGNTNETTGLFGAPIAEHKGIPPVHFEKLACTACHSGRLPEAETVRTKTSRAHGLGTLNVNKSKDVLPHIIYPVFVEGEDGKIGLAKLLWPAYWGRYEGDKVTPLNLEVVRPIASKVITEESMPSSGGWPDLTKEGIKKILSQLSDKINAEAVYVAGGKLYRVNGDGELTGEQHKSGEPYYWPIAHNVRPAAQSLGAKRCEDCHSTEAGFCFGKVEVDTPVRSERGKYVSMFKFQDISPWYMKLFAISFVFRPWLKVVAVIAALIIAAVLLLYGLKALGYITKSISEDNQAGQS